MNPQPAVKRSPKTTANCVLAVLHSRAGIFQFRLTSRKARNSNFVAASSVRKRPRSRTALRKQLGVSRKWGDEDGSDIPVGPLPAGGSRMGWVLRLLETEIDSPGPGVDVMEISRSGDLGGFANLGLTLAEAKQLLARVQQAVVAAQAHRHAVLRPDCSSCGGGCHIKDWRLHQVATLFGVGRCGCRGFAASAVVIARLVSAGPRIVGDTGAGPAPSSSFRFDALSCRRWRAGASSACGGREEPRDFARPYAQNRRATSRPPPGGQAGGHHRHRRLDLHP